MLQTLAFRLGSRCTTSRFISKPTLMSNKLLKLPVISTRGFSADEADKDVHFRMTNIRHPLNAKPIDQLTDAELADKFGRQQNHIWNLDELDEKCTKSYHFQPKTISDHFMWNLLQVLYHSFNFATGYKKENPTVRSIEWRLIVLESVAGVPGFVAAGFRHLRSLRLLRKDNGFIATLLEEAENERMHLLVCMKMFGATSLVRAVVLAAQTLLTPTLMLVYAVHPRSMHRFVGFLEETATDTYIGIINAIETPGTALNVAWKDTPAPDIAKGYWKLPDDAKWVDTLRCICADETHHRDVNHTYASLKEGMLNPFLAEHKKDAAIAWRLHMAGDTAWPSKNKTITEETRRGSTEQV